MAAESGAQSTHRAPGNRGMWLVLCLLCAGASLAMASQTWWKVTAGTQTIAVSGSAALAGLPQALAAALAAAAVLSLTLRGWGRTVLALVIAVIGIAMTGVGLLGPEPSTEVVARQVQTVSLDAPGALTRGWGGYGFGCVGILTLAAGIALMVVRRPAAGADRFTRTAPTTPVDAADDPLAVWRAQDAGEDPTETAAEAEESQVLDR